MRIRQDLERHAAIIAKWAENLPIKKVYIFGSRVRGDATDASDLDIAVEFQPPASVDETVLNWSHQNETDFADLKKALKVPVSLHIDRDDACMASNLGRRGYTCALCCKGRVRVNPTRRPTKTNGRSQMIGAAECVRT